MDMDRIRELEQLPEAEASRRIGEIRKRYGKEICLLAHLYQRKAITEHADFVGDSFGLSRSASMSESKYIVFCGVRFMAESAAILCRPEQEVLHPDPEAGCPMADMAPMDEVKPGWERLCELTGTKPVPVTYMNSTADIKAFCGERGGTICTSSNADKTFEWAFQQGEKIFFLPDEHLGRNTALKYGFENDEIAVWDPDAKDGGEPENYKDAKVILWKGYCPVHQKFTVRDVEHVRKFYPKAKVLVHPECPADVVALADGVGSTSYLTNYVENSQPGDEIFIGTEINLIQNLQQDFPDRKIAKLHRSLCLTMYQITMGRLLYCLENLETFERVQVEDSVKHHSRVALDRMLSLF